MENLVKQRKRMNPVRMEFSRKINKKLIAEICKYIHMDKNHVFMSRVPFIICICNPELSENARSRKGKAVLSEEESANDTAAERKRKSDRTD